MARPATVRFFGDHHQLREHRAWWTLRFARLLSSAERIALASLVGNTPYVTTLEWITNRQCRLDPDIGWFERVDAPVLYRAMYRLFHAIHEALPLSAVFLRDGQLFDGDPALTELTHRQLDLLVGATRRRT